LADLAALYIIRSLRRFVISGGIVPVTTVAISLYVK